MRARRQSARTLPQLTDYSCYCLRIPVAYRFGPMRPPLSAVTSGGVRSFPTEKTVNVRQRCFRHDSNSPTKLITKREEHLRQRRQDFKIIPVDRLPTRAVTKAIRERAIHV